MSENIQRSTGTPRSYKFDRGGMPTEFGPFIGVVKNNVDPTRQGRLQVYIEQFGGDAADDPSQWRTVSYCPPFYGVTPKSGTSNGTGGYTPGNQQSYGMWFTPPDIGVQVMCFFVAGDPNQGYYMGCVPEQGINHMIPAIGAVSKDKAQTQNNNQSTYLSNSPLLPVTEINNDSEAINENPRFFDQPKPVHSYLAAILFQQGLAADPVRGPIGSSSQRESPSACFGMSTPGRAIYQGGLGDKESLKQIETATPEDVQVIGRRGGHTFVMDDGNIEGTDNLIRIRTAKGHQITMSDDGNCFYICHANGQTWVELGQEGTLDVFTTNSVNLRSEGTINLHADKDINLYAGENLNLKGKQSTVIQSEGDLNIANKGAMTLFSEGKIGIKSGSTLAMQSKVGSWEATATLNFKGGLLNLNGPPGLPVETPKGLTKYLMPDTEFNSSVGWQVKQTGIESICTRAPTHEPYPYHNQGVQVQVNLEEGQSTPPPDAPNIPDDWSITRDE